MGIAFFLALPCSPLAAAHPKTWQPPKANRLYRFTEYLRYFRPNHNLIAIKQLQTAQTVALTV